VNAIVLGSSEGRTEKPNIGDAVTFVLTEQFDMTVEESNCMSTHGLMPDYILPLGLNYADAEALIVTLGRTSMEAFPTAPPREIEDVIRGCLTLPLLAARHYLEAREGKGGKIVLVGSYAHSHPFSTGTAYCAAKAGLNMAARTLAWETSDLGFRTFIVHPYHVVGTPMWDTVQDGVMHNKSYTREEADNYAEKDLKMPFMSPREIADVIGMLLTERSLEWLSGSNVELFGGTR
jgi:NAD(P)-dependent dehydrogenase (short-subunit alcohol dehydrogenase family)